MYKNLMWKGDLVMESPYSKRPTKLVRPYRLTIDVPWGGPNGCGRMLCYVPYM